MCISGCIPKIQKEKKKSHLEAVAATYHTLTHLLSWCKTRHRESVAAQEIHCDISTKLNFFICLVIKVYLGSRVTLSKVIVVCVMFCTCMYNFFEKV